MTLSLGLSLSFDGGARDEREGGDFELLRCCCDVVRVAASKRTTIDP